MDHQFRNAAFGGFNKQDVLDYLEAASQESSRQLQELRDALAQAQEQLDAARVRERELTTRVEQLSQEQRQQQQEVQRLRGDLGTAQAESKLLRVELEKSQQTCQDLQGQVQRLTPDADAYAAVKERAAGVELDAHRRAQGIVDQAHNEEQRLRRELEQWLASVGKEYNDLRGQIDTALAQAGGELNKVSQTFAQISQSLKRQDATLKTLSTVCQEKPAPPAPEKKPEKKPVPGPGSLLKR